ncbi:MAG: family 43 glycosylhydrolase [Clostridia bacterium]|nr:family 43 glycosylhydrolase [Clostridia bacterium]
MKKSEINIRDPFILKENGVYYLYGTRGANFGVKVNGFDVYTSTDLEEWSAPIPCFTCEDYAMNAGVSWAPEVHRYQGAFYLFATFTQPNGLRGTYCLRAETPEGPFVPHSKGALTPTDWECLDGTLFVQDGVPYLVFCHEHTQIINGTICYLRLKPDLTAAEGDPMLLFHGDDPFFVPRLPAGEHYVTDGPFLFRFRGRLFMLWSTILSNQYAQCLAEFLDGRLDGRLAHLPPLITDDGGHGMIFEADGVPTLTFHSPNRSGTERPQFLPLAPLMDAVLSKSE